MSLEDSKYDPLPPYEEFCEPLLEVVAVPLWVQPLAEVYAALVL